jgi:1-acyl-sn-glycerol-3-phosphate acyltransferase
MASTKRNPIWKPIRRRLGRMYLRLIGWRVEGDVPAEPRYVAIAAPHTSYWDFPHMIAFGFATDQYISFLMKASMFKGPLAPVFRKLGGIPVDRSGSFGLVDSVVREFEKNDQLIIVIAPEGTRSKRDHWKSGFYNIAVKADVPIALGFMDYENKVVGYGPLLIPSGDEAGDASMMADFYDDKRGKYPDQATPASLG